MEGSSVLQLTTIGFGLTWWMEACGNGAIGRARTPPKNRTLSSCWGQSPLANLLKILRSLGTEAYEESPISTRKREGAFAQPR